MLISMCQWHATTGRSPSVCLEGTGLPVLGVPNGALACPSDLYQVLCRSTFSSAGQRLQIIPYLDIWLICALTREQTICDTDLRRFYEFWMTARGDCHSESWQEDSVGDDCWVPGPFIRLLASPWSHVWLRWHYVSTSRTCARRTSTLHTVSGGHSEFIALVTLHFSRSISRSGAVVQQACSKKWDLFDG